MYSRYEAMDLATLSRFSGLSGARSPRPPLFVATAQLGTDQMLATKGMFLRASFCAISIASRKFEFSAFVVTDAGSLFSSGCQRSSGIATRPQATRRLSRLY